MKKFKFSGMPTFFGKNLILKEIIYGLNFGIIIGFIFGLIISMQHIILNKYIEYGLSRLLIDTLQTKLTSNVGTSVLLLIVLFGLICLIAYVKKNNENLFTRLRISCYIFLFSFLTLKWVLMNFKGYTIHSLFIKLFMQVKKLLFGEIDFNIFLSQWIRNIHFVLLFLGVIVVTVIFVRILKKVNLSPVTRILKSKYFIKSAAILFTFIIILNAYVFVDNKINKPEGPNVILIVVDTLRADHMSCYGYTRLTTPEIDKFSSNSYLFKNCFSTAPWTTPSVASIFTSKYPSELGFADEPVVLNDRNVTLAEMFKNNNYMTAGIISHDYISSTLGFDQGFDLYDEKNCQGIGYISSPSIVNKAIKFLKKQQKFFLFLHFFDPHWDYILHEGFNYYPGYKGNLYSGQSIDELRENARFFTSDDIRFVKSLFDSEISFTDKYIGLLLNFLKENKIFDKTLIIFTADHGEEFLERGDFWIGHTRTLYQELIHVPLIIKMPEQRERKEIDTSVSLIDLMPSLCKFAGINIPKKYEYSGDSIDLNSKETSPNRAIFSETQRFASLQSIVWDGWKLIVDPDTNLLLLFNLKADPVESENVLINNGSLANFLEQALREWSMETQSEITSKEAKKPKFTQEQIERLKSLGYIK